MAFCIAAAVLFISISGVIARQCPLLLARDGAMKTGCYITMLKPETSHERMLDIVGEAQHMCDDSKLYGMVERLAKAFTMRLSKTALNAVSYQTWMLSVNAVSRRVCSFVLAWPVS